MHGKAGNFIFQEERFHPAVLLHRILMVHSKTLALQKSRRPGNISSADCNVAVGTATRYLHQLYRTTYHNRFLTLPWCPRKKGSKKSCRPLGRCFVTCVDS